MTTAKTFDIHDYDFLYEDEIDVLEARMKLTFSKRKLSRRLSRAIPGHIM